MKLSPDNALSRWTEDYILRYNPLRIIFCQVQTHPFEGASVLPVSEDHSANTVMSYTDYRFRAPQFSGSETGSGSEVDATYALVAPDHFMPYDIAALQAVYDPDTNYRTTDDTYVFSDTPFYTTIWDAGGVDTVVGGGGYDLVMLDQYNMSDVQLGPHEEFLLLAADGFAVQMVGIAGVQFADQLYTVV